MSKITKILTVAAAFGVVGMVALPMASYAATSDVTVGVQVQDGLTLEDGTTGGSALDNYFHNFGAASNATDSTGAASEATPGKVKVYSNVANGYILTLADKDAVTDLVSGSNTIPTNATHAAGTPGWAVKVATAPGGALGATRLAMPASTSLTPISLHNAAGVAASTGDVYSYAFSSSIAASTVTGTYSDTVTFTLTSK